MIAAQHRLASVVFSSFILLGPTAVAAEPLTAPQWREDLNASARWCGCSRASEIARSETQSLVRALAEAQARGLSAWRAARQERSFALFAAALQRLLELRRQQSDAIPGSYPSTSASYLSPQWLPRADISRPRLLKRDIRNFSIIVWRPTFQLPALVDDQVVRTRRQNLQRF